MSRVTVGDGQTAESRGRRRWPIEQKRRIVEESFAPGASIAQVARRNSANANQVHYWRHLYKQGLLGGSAPAPALLPVRVMEDSAVTVVGVERPAEDKVGQAGIWQSSGVIEIDVKRGRVRVEGAAHAESLRTVLEALLG